MKIEITDEMFSFLTNLSHELKTQDNRSTRSPYFYQIEEMDEILTADGYGDRVIWMTDDGEDILRTDEEIRNFICSANESVSNFDYDKLNYFDKEEYLIHSGYTKFDVKDIPRYTNCFLTEKAYNEHVKVNGHNLNNPHSYLFYANRNEELGKLINFIKETF